jgi:hypothetical protein
MQSIGTNPVALFSVIFEAKGGKRTLWELRNATARTLISDCRCSIYAV